MAAYVAVGRIGRGQLRLGRATLEALQLERTDARAARGLQAPVLTELGTTDDLADRLARFRELLGQMTFYLFNSGWY